MSRFERIYIVIVTLSLTIQLAGFYLQFNQYINQPHLPSLLPTPVGSEMSAK